MPHLRKISLAAAAVLLCTGCTTGDPIVPPLVTADEEQTDDTAEITDLPFVTRAAATETTDYSEERSALFSYLTSDTSEKTTRTTAETRTETGLETVLSGSDSETVTETETTAETKRTPHQPAEAEDDGVVPLYCTAAVDLPGGITLRKAAEPFARMVTKIPDGTTLSVTGFMEGEKPVGGTNRWLRAEYNGKTGFFSADDAIVRCEMEPQELSDTQCMALAKLLYPQARELLHGFRHEGGYPPLEPVGVYDGDYSRLRPDRTLDTLYARFFAYFTEDLAGALDDTCKEQDGALWVKMGTVGRSPVMAETVTEMTARSGRQLSFRVRTDYYADSYAAMGAEFAENAFVLKFADGCWKVAEIAGD